MIDNLPHVVDEPTEQDAQELLDRMIYGIYAVYDALDGDTHMYRHGIGWSQGKEDGTGVSYRERMHDEGELDKIPYMSIEPVEMAKTR